MLVLALCAAWAGPAAGPQPHQHHPDTLGTVDFGVSCTDAVADDFDRALALLHHMQYDEAQAAFQHVVTAEPACAMAHWGLAMTRFQPLWPSRPGPDVLAQAWDELQHARSLGLQTDREAALVAAAEAFFRDPQTAEWWTRIQRWSEAMSQAYHAHPDDIETAALYALSQLAAGQVAEDRMAYHARAADVLKSIYDRVPAHPGAIHYTIHANDVDARAGESLEIVQS